MLYELPRKERHVARRDEDGPKVRSKETGLDAGQRSLAARSQVRDSAHFGGGMPSLADDDDLFAAERQGIVDPVEEGGVPDLQRELVPPHPAALPAGQDHAGASRRLAHQLLRSQTGGLARLSVRLCDA